MKTPVNVLVSIYTNKHIPFSKGNYIGCLEPAITEDTSIAQQDIHSTNSVTLQRMMSEEVQLDIFDPPHHKLKVGIKSKLDILLKEYASQFTKDERNRLRNCSQERSSAAADPVGLLQLL